jgi:hemoglobin
MIAPGRLAFPGMHRFALILVLAACGTKPAVRPAVDAPSLYDRLGGHDAIMGLVDDLLAGVAADDRIADRFRDVDLHHLADMLVAQLCSKTGGPCEYTGRDMRTAHAGMGISAADFDAFVDDLDKALDKHGVPPADHKELVAILRSLTGEIITK